MNKKKNVPRKMSNKKCESTSDETEDDIMLTSKQKRNTFTDISDKDLYLEDSLHEILEHSKDSVKKRKSPRNKCYDSNDPSQTDSQNASISDIYDIGSESSDELYSPPKTVKRKSTKSRLLSNKQNQAKKKKPPESRVKVKSTESKNVLNKSKKADTTEKSKTGTLCYTQVCA